MFEMCCRYVKALVLVISLVIGLQAQAAPESIKICAKYQRSDMSYSPNFRLQAVWGEGHVLNKAIKFYEFNNYESYLVILWPNNQISLFEARADNKPSFVEQGYKDQRNVKWIIKEGWSFCE